MRFILFVGLVTSIVTALEASAQTLLERSPNIQGVWGVERGHATFVLAHRFEVLSGGDELFSVPTLTLAVGLPLGLTAGVDFTSFSEAIPERITGNEAQYWLKKPVAIRSNVQAAFLGGYNSAAKSAESALDLRVGLGRVELYGEARGHSSLFGTGTAGASGTVGASLRLNRHVAITGDVGRVITEDTVPGAWSAAVAFEIPGSPHTLAFQVANSGATTLQGATRAKTVGSKDFRHGFTFTVPLGNRERWIRIFDPAPLPSSPEASVGALRITIRDSAFDPGERRIAAGEQAEWINLDQVAHTVTAVDGSWDSGSMDEGDDYSRTFVAPGRYAYYCIPHPEMRGTIIVDP